MHSRRLRHGGDTVTLRFGHEGVLYRGAFVMYDHRTESRWNHATGLAMQGPLTGRRLRSIPARLMLWEEWKRQHPATTVLVGEGAKGLLEYLAGYFGEYEARGSSVDRFGLSVGRGPAPVLYSFERLKRREVINDTVQRRPLVAVMEPDSLQTAVFSRRVGGRTLRFVAVGAADTAGGSPALMRDTQTNSLWDRLSGRALRGPLAGTELDPLVGVIWNRERWRGIHPEGRVRGR